VEPSKLRLSDLLTEALAGLVQRPGRSVLTMLGTVLGVGSFVAVLGLTSTASGQIDKHFTGLAATQVVVEDIGSDNESDDAVSFPPDASTRVESLNGVTHGGVWWPIPAENLSITAAPGVDGAAGLTLTAIEPSALDAARPHIQAGRLYDAFHESRGEHVAVLGAVAAQRLGITRIDGQPAVFVAGVPYTVVGIIDDVERMPDLLFSVLLPSSTARTVYGDPTVSRPSMLVEVEVGAAQLIAGQAPIVLRPDAPERFRVLAASSAKALQGSVSSDLSVLFLLLAGISLVIGAVGITNTTLVAVLERTPEIGVRRALGARPRHVAVQFLTESTTLGMLGGLIGSSVGVVIVITVAIIQNWTAVLAPWTVLGAPPIGALIGLVAGLYPALRASRIEPAEALRR
jgi:putative ABC transport system permease protein